MRCLISSKTQDVKQARQESLEGLQSQAEKIKLTSDRKHKLASVGDSVRIAVFKIGGGRTDFNNVLGSILDIQDGQ